MSTMSDLDIMRQQAADYAADLQRLSYDVQVLQWRTALDNYEPVARAFAHGFAVEYSGTLRDPDTGFTAEHATHGVTMFCDDSQLPLGNIISNGPHAIALFDDGQSVRPFYCAGWNPRETDKQRDPSMHPGTSPYVLWHPFPLSQGTRPDNGRPVDMSGWMLGPRRAYHFKVTPLYLWANGDWRPEEPITLNFPGFPPIQGIGPVITEITEP